MNGAPRNCRGSVLIIVLWVAFGLVALALYLAGSVSLELRAADNRAANIEAEHAIAGATRYLSNVLATVQYPGTLPDPATYRYDNVSVGSATFWFIGQADEQEMELGAPYFGLADESGKLNINVASREMLEALPRMTPKLAAAIIDWRDVNDEVTDGGAESQAYLGRSPAYRCKNADFESVDELRLVNGAQLDVLYGEDANLNGLLDANENDGDAVPPNDNRDGRLDSGILAWLTVHTRQPTTGTNVNQPQQLAPLLQEKFGAERANQVLARVGDNSGNVLQFYMRSGLTREEFVQIEGNLIGTNSVGLINVNTASEAVLACIPGIGTEKASTLIAHRRANPDKLNTVAWVKDTLDEQAARQAGPWITGRSYQFGADIAAVGRFGRGYQRVKLIFDTSDGAPKIRYRQDLTHYGWALGANVRRTIELARNVR